MARSFLYRDGVKPFRRAALTAVLIACSAITVPAQSLRGSRASVDRMFTRAVRNDLDFLRTSKGVYEAVNDGELVMISITMDMMLEEVSYPFVLPKTKDVLNAFARKYRTACGERLVVTSASRPRIEQPRNASAKSVHPTGMAIDVRRPTGICLTWMRAELVALERQGVLEATEERHPVHFHVAVLQRGKFAPVAPAVATATRLPAVPTAGSTIGAAPSAMMDSADGAVVPVTPAPAEATTYTVRKGDNLSVIAKKFGTSVAHLRSVNGLKGMAIQPGQKLRLN